MFHEINFLLQSLNIRIMCAVVTSFKLSTNEYSQTLIHVLTLIGPYLYHNLRNVHFKALRNKRLNRINLILRVSSLKKFSSVKSPNSVASWHHQGDRLRSRRISLVLKTYCVQTESCSLIAGQKSWLSYDLNAPNR